MSIELSQNGDIITLLCNDKGELGMMSKDELEEFIYNNVGIAVNISDDMLSKFRKNGRLDITTTVEEKVTVEQQSTPNQNIFEKEEGNKEEYTGNKLQRSEFSVFENGNGMDAGELLVKFTEKKYFIWKAIIKRGKAVYESNMGFEEDGRLVNSTYNLGVVQINLLSCIVRDINPQSTGMNSRIVNNYIVQKKDNEYHLIMNCQFDDGEVTGKYLLRHIDDIRKELKIF